MAHPTILQILNIKTQCGKLIVRTYAQFPHPALEWENAQARMKLMGHPSNLLQDILHLLCKCCPPYDDTEGVQVRCYFQGIHTHPVSPSGFSLLEAEVEGVLGTTEQQLESFKGNLTPPLLSSVASCCYSCKQGMERLDTWADIGRIICRRKRMLKLYHLL